MTTATSSSKQPLAIQSYESALNIPNPLDIYGIGEATILMRLGAAYLHYGNIQKSTMHYGRAVKLITQRRTEWAVVAEESGIIVDDYQNVPDQSLARTMVNFHEYVGAGVEVMDALMLLRLMSIQCIQKIEDINRRQKVTKR